MTKFVVLDLSRLLSRVNRKVPSGIDRVEMAYAKHFIKATSDHVEFVAMDVLGNIKTLNRNVACRFVIETEALWRNGVKPTSANAVSRYCAMQLKTQLLLSRTLAPTHRPDREGPGLVYLLVSHHHLDRLGTIQALKSRSNALFVCMVHDLVPIEWPEYARPGHDRRHITRMETVAKLADGIIVNSEATAKALQPFLNRANRSVPVSVAHLGVSIIPRSERQTLPAQKPYFVCIGTIEPRKNHLMLLAMWRQLALEFGSAAPRLVIVGQRGWEYENIADLLDRSPAIHRTVEEHNRMCDAELAPLLTNARALLLPSFIEGYGLPVAEALAAGVPVICSDIPALRQVGGAVPDYLDPLDGLGWKDAIKEYSTENSARRNAQLVRLSTWQPPTWERHFEIVEEFLEKLAMQRQ